MSRLELKIPPALQALIVTLLMWLVSRHLPGISLPGPASHLAFVAFSGLGALVAVSGVVSFRKAGTTVDPRTTVDSTTLVTSGVYQKSRNPMYLGMLLFLIGWGLFLSNAWSLLLPIGFVLYMNRFQIRPEERAMEATFGVEYVVYKSRVRRWV